MSEPMDEQQKNFLKSVHRKELDALADQETAELLPTLRVMINGKLVFSQERLRDGIKRIIHKYQRP